jgi:hypothetical protein
LSNRMAGPQASTRRAWGKRYTVFSIICLVDLTAWMDERTFGAVTPCWAKDLNLTVAQIGTGSFPAAVRGRPPGAFLLAFATSEKPEQMTSSASLSWTTFIRTRQNELPPLANSVRAASGPRCVSAAYSRVVSAQRIMDRDSDLSGHDARMAGRHLGHLCASQPLPHRRRHRVGTGRQWLYGQRHLWLLPWLGLRTYVRRPLPPGTGCRPDHQRTWLSGGSLYHVAGGPRDRHIRCRLTVQPVLLRCGQCLLGRRRKAGVHRDIERRLCRRTSCRRVHHRQLVGYLGAPCGHRRRARDGYNLAFRWHRVPALHHPDLYSARGGYGPAVPQM